MNRLLLLAPRIATNRLWALAGEVPSFHIAPARTRDARDLITGSVLGTYNSASPAWAVGPDGVLALPAANAPVIEYDPTTLACLGARIWGAVMNLCLRSEELTDATWIASASSMSANTVIAPTGQLTADTLTGTGGVDFIYQIITVSPNTTYTASVFVRLGTMPAANYRVAVYDQTAGSFIAVDVVVAQTPTSSGWTRISYQFTTPSGCTSIRWYPFRSISATGQTVHLFGAQVNSGPLGPYVPTTTLAASSTADVWSITGADAARIINGAQFTVYMDGYRTFTGNFPDYPSFYAISDGSNSNTCPGYGIQGGQAITNYQIISGGIGQTDFVSVNLGGSQSMKIVQALATNDSRFGVNGTLTAADTSVTMPVGLNKISIGSSAANANFGNFYIREFSIFRSRRPNSNLLSIMSS